VRWVVRVVTCARTWSVALSGVDGALVEVEADLAQGLPMLTVVGLPDTAVTEARDRVRAAVVNSRQTWPAKRITVGLSPATLPKAGSSFDLAIAVAVLAGAGALDPAAVSGLVVLGELGLDGRVRPVVGILPAVLAAVRAGVPRVVVPMACMAEARLVPGAQVTGVSSLTMLVARLRGEQVEDPEPAPRPTPPDPEAALARDLCQVAGQATGRWAVEVAAAGGHHLFLQGPPGCGKTMLAERLPGLLPDLSAAEALEVSAVHSVAGLLPAGSPLVVRPPMRAPHHTTSATALVGGGSTRLRPGACSLAHRGVLFLDEAPEFGRGPLEALRTVLEKGHVDVARTGGSARFPARFSLILAANPCACAVSGAGPLDCSCRPEARRTYLSRISGALLDRVDLQLRLAPVTQADLAAGPSANETTATVAARVASARGLAATRLEGTPWRTNGEVPGPVLQHRWPPARGAQRPSHLLAGNGKLSLRGVDSVLRVAWTLADLDGVARPDQGHVRAALSLRRQATVGEQAA